MTEQNSNVHPLSRGACPECAQLRLQVFALQRERDAALLAVAREREEVNALRLSYPRSPSVQPAEVWYQRPDPPLRYVLADRVNVLLKGRLGILHAAAKSAASRVRAMTRTGHAR
jgi:hypothetical protein